MKFNLLKQLGLARRGELIFDRGVVQTPAFMPVGTYGTVKGMRPEEVAATGAQILLGNTFHLMLRPGTEVIAKHGDLHDFMQWQGPILTDSGGFQVFSLMYGTVHDEIKSKGKKQENNAVLNITEEGVLFRSYRNGAPILLTPESSVQAQAVLMHVFLGNCSDD